MWSHYGDHPPATKALRVTPFKPAARRRVPRPDFYLSAAPAPYPIYHELADPYLESYYAKPSMRRILLQHGIIHPKDYEVIFGPDRSGKAQSTQETLRKITLLTSAQRRPVPSERDLLPYLPDAMRRLVRAGAKMNEESLRGAREELMSRPLDYVIIRLEEQLRAVKHAAYVSKQPKVAGNVLTLGFRDFAYDNLDPQNKEKGQVKTFYPAPKGADLDAEKLAILHREQEAVQHFEDRYHHLHDEQQEMTRAQHYNDPTAHHREAPKGQGKERAHSTQLTRIRTKLHKRQDDAAGGDQAKKRPKKKYTPSPAPKSEVKNTKKQMEAIEYRKKTEEKRAKAAERKKYQTNVSAERKPPHKCHVDDPTEDSIHRKAERKREEEKAKRRKAREKELAGNASRTASTQDTTDHASTQDTADQSAYSSTMGSTQPASSSVPEDMSSAQSASAQAEQKQPGRQENEHDDKDPRLPKFPSGTWPWRHLQNEQAQLAEQQAPPPTALEPARNSLTVGPDGKLEYDTISEYVDVAADSTLPQPDDTARQSPMDSEIREQLASDWPQLASDWPRFAGEGAPESSSLDNFGDKADTASAPYPSAIKADAEGAEYYDTRSSFVDVNSPEVEDIAAFIIEDTLSHASDALDGSVTTDDRSDNVAAVSSFNAEQPQEMGVSDLKQQELELSQSRETLKTADAEASKDPRHNHKSAELQKLVATHGKWSAVRIPHLEDAHILEPVRESSEHETPQTTAHVAVPSAVDQAHAPVPLVDNVYGPVQITNVRSAEYVPSHTDVREMEPASDGHAPSQAAFPAASAPKAEVDVQSVDADSHPDASEKSQESDEMRSYASNVTDETIRLAHETLPVTPAVSPAPSATQMASDRDTNASPRPASPPSSPTRVNETLRHAEPHVEESPPMSDIPARPAPSQAEYFHPDEHRVAKSGSRIDLAQEPKTAASSAPSVENSPVPVTHVRSAEEVPSHTYVRETEPAFLREGHAPPPVASSAMVHARPEVERSVSPTASRIHLQAAHDTDTTASPAVSHVNLHAQEITDDVVQSAQNVPSSAQFFVSPAGSHVDLTTTDERQASRNDLHVEGVHDHTESGPSPAVSQAKLSPENNHDSGSSKPPSSAGSTTSLSTAADIADELEHKAARNVSSSSNIPSSEASPMGSRTDLRAADMTEELLLNALAMESVTQLVAPPSRTTVTNVPSITIVPASPDLDHHRNAGH